MISKKENTDNIMNITNVYSFTVKGLRETNEDAHILFKNDDFVIYGVCDGHGGAQIAKFISGIIPDIFEASDFKHPLNSQYIKSVFEKIQNKLKETKSLRAYEAGCTCTIFFKYIKSNEFYTINLGDSRIIGCYGIAKQDMPNKIIGCTVEQLTTDHKPYDPKELKSITSKGGRVELIDGIYRINGLSLSRSFGDLDNPHISCKPDIKKYNTIYKNSNQIKKLMFIIIACDGLYDVLDNNLICNHIIMNYYDKTFKRKHKINDKTKTKNKEERRLYTNPAEELCNFALENETMDNVSVIALFFD